MWALLWGTAASGGEAILAITVKGPDGGIVLQDELLLPAERMLPSPDGKQTLAIYASVFDDTKAIIELATGPTKDGKPKTKVAKSIEVVQHINKLDTITYKTSTWNIDVVLGTAYDAPAALAAPEDTHRYVLVWDDASLIVDPKDPKSAVSKERELPARDDVDSQASPMRVVDTWGETHLELATVPEPGPAHCQAGGPPPEGFSLQHYVALPDLVPKVTAKELAMKFPDGTGYRVAAGVPVVAEGEGTWRVKTGGLSFLVEAGSDDLAFYYRPSVHFAEGTGALSLQPGVIGSTKLGPVEWTAAEAVSVAGLRGARAPIATVQVPCAEVRLSPDLTRMK